ncbi:tetratricopeptide repeat protein [Nitrospira sp. MA-1]|nr:tetratricopeptide repeat protein [Nitrospira sp. MA-1]
MTYNLKVIKKRNVFEIHFWVGIFLIMLRVGGCATAPQPPQNEPLPPPENATPLVAQLLLDGNRLFAEHRWTSAIIKYEEAVQAQPKLAEAHYNLGMALYKKGPVSAARPHFLKAADLAPGHPVIRNAPPFRKYGTVESSPPISAPNDYYEDQD